MTIATRRVTNNIWRKRRLTVSSRDRRDPILASREVVNLPVEESILGGVVEGIPSGVTKRSKLGNPQKKLAIYHGKSPINGSISAAMFDCRRVYIPMMKNWTPRSWDMGPDKNYVRLSTYDRNYTSKSFYGDLVWILLDRGGNKPYWSWNGLVWTWKYSGKKEFGPLNMGWGFHTKGNVIP